ncbi:MAG: hypothetical protein AB7T59_06505 [Hyphomonadaceae bacterium]
MAPRYTLVWTEEVQSLRDISTDEVIELRNKALWRIRLAEAAIDNDPAIAKFGAAADIDDLVWSKFDVGKHWFMLEFRPAAIREYVVTLTTPPSDDIPPPSDAERRRPDRRSRNSQNAPAHKTNEDGSASGRIRAAFDSAGRAITVLLRFTRRELSRAKRTYKSCMRYGWAQLRQHTRRSYRSVRYNTRIFGVSLHNISRRLASTLATGSNSFTRISERFAQRVRFEAHLEPRCIGQRSGLAILLYSWIRDEPPPVDWSADLFGALPIDWTANLFGVLPKEERAIA